MLTLAIIMCVGARSAAADIGSVDKPINISEVKMQYRNVSIWAANVTKEIVWGSPLTTAPSNEPQFNITMRGYPLKWNLTINNFPEYPGNDPKVAANCYRHLLNVTRSNTDYRNVSACITSTVELAAFHFDTVEKFINDTLAELTTFENVTNVRKNISDEESRINELVRPLVTLRINYLPSMSFCPLNITWPLTKDDWSRVCPDLIPLED